MQTVWLLLPDQPVTPGQLWGCCTSHSCCASSVRGSSGPPEGSPALFLTLLEGCFQLLDCGNQGSSSGLVCGWSQRVLISTHTGGGRRGGCTYPADPRCSRRRSPAPSGWWPTPAGILGSGAKRGRETWRDLSVSCPCGRSLRTHLEAWPVRTHLGAWPGAPPHAACSGVFGILKTRKKTS